VDPIPTGAVAFRRSERAKRVQGTKEEAAASSGVDERSGGEATTLCCLCPKERGREEWGSPIGWSKRRGERGSNWGLVDGHAARRGGGVTIVARDQRAWGGVRDRRDRGKWHAHGPRWGTSVDRSAWTGPRYTMTFCDYLK
jgi:hypothetical protein